MSCWNILLAERAAQCIGLDHAGVDFITEDISRRSWREIGGAICEINPTPGIALDAAPEMLLDYLFPNADTGRIPIVLIVGTAAETAGVLEPLLGHLRDHAIPAGHIHNRRAFYRAQEITARETPVRTLLAQLLASPGLDCVVAQVDPRELETEGLDTPCCDVVAYHCSPEEAGRIQASNRSVAGFVRQWPHPTAAELWVLLEMCLG